MTRNRIIYPSLAVWADGTLLHRVTTFGSTTTFTSEDIFEMGQLDIIDVVDDIPAVAITVDTNDFGSVNTVAKLAGVSTSNFLSTATSGTGTLTVASGTVTPIEIAYYNGIALSQFSTACGSTGGQPFWAPVQNECSLGSDADILDQTMFMDQVFINRLELSYSQGANATENYSGETDNKMWLLNDGAYVSWEQWTTSALTTGWSDPSPRVVVSLPLTSVIPTLSDGTPGFLFQDLNGARAVRFYRAADKVTKNYEVTTGVAGTTGKFVYDSSTGKVYFPTDFATSTTLNNTAPVSADKLTLIYCSDAYAAPVATRATGDSTTVSAQYFADLAAADDISSDVGAVRAGQIELYLVDPDTTTTYVRALRLTSATISSDLTREPLQELGRLRPYDRPVTLPIPITVSVETTAADLEHYALFAGKKSAFDAGTLDDIDIQDLMSNDNSALVVMIYQQTDEEAGGTSDNRRVITTDLIGNHYFCVGQKSDDSLYDGFNVAHNGAGNVYIAADREYPLKTIIVPSLKITDEAFNLAIGSNATQTYGFRANNKLFVVQGYVPVEHAIMDPGFQVNS